jgi:hypothetical protein
MAYVRDDLLKDLKNNIIEIRLVSGDVVRCSLKKHNLPPSYIEEQKDVQNFHDENPEKIAAFNVNGAGGWFTFNVEDVEYVQVVDVL